MRPSALLAKLRSQGGEIRLGEDGSLYVRNCSPELKCQIHEEAYCIRALLRDHQAAIRWERDRACHCAARPFAHPPHRPGDVWATLKQVLAARDAAEVSEVMAKVDAPQGPPSTAGNEQPKQSPPAGTGGRKGQQ